MLRTQRKGVSPLIAAVLLIAFTMAVAAILTAWVTTFTEDQTEAVSNQSEQFTSCSGGVIDILDTASDSNSVTVSVANTGNANFGNVSVVALAGGSVVGSSYDIGELRQGAVDSTTVDTSAQAETIRVSDTTCSSVTATESIQ